MIVPASIKASDLNRRVTAKAYTYTQGAAGGVVATLAESIDTWAKVEQLGGDTSTQEAQQISSAQYRLTMRYRAALNENWLFFYEGLPLKVKQMQVDNPAYKRYWIIYCSVTIQQADWS